MTLRVEEDLDIAFGVRIMEERERIGLLQQELAEKLGVSQKSISKYERNDRRPTYGTLCRMADIFGVTTDYLLGKTDERNPGWPWPTDENDDISKDGHKRMTLGECLRSLIVGGIVKDDDRIRITRTLPEFNLTEMRKGLWFEDQIVSWFNLEIREFRWEEGKGCTVTVGEGCADAKREHLMSSLEKGMKEILPKLCKEKKEAVPEETAMELRLNDADISRALKDRLLRIMKEDMDKKTVPPIVSDFLKQQISTAVKEELANEMASDHNPYEC